MQKIEKKVTFSGSLARRTLIICLLFLIIPLFVHTFFLYQREVEVAEADVRANLKAIGGEMAKRISDQIHFDWQLLNVKLCNVTLEAVFPIKKMAQGGHLSGQFAILNEKKDALLVGRAISNTEVKVLVHPLCELLSIKNPPFPIDTGINALESLDRWVEKIPIPQTQLQCVLGTSNERVYELQRQHLFFRIGTFLVFVALLGGGLVTLFYRRLSKPLNALCLTMKRVAEGAVHSRYVRQWLGFEINSIGLTFNAMMDDLLLSTQEAEVERTKREKLAQELKLGHDVQENLLPKHFPTILDFEVSGVSLPAYEVGGDFYDVLPLDSEKTLIVVADLAGKGISSCLFALGLRSSLRALAANLGSDLKQIVKQANELFLIDAEETGQFATLWIAILEKRSLHFVSLGHPPALLKREGALIELSTEGPALGLAPYKSIEVGVMQFKEGDELLIFSDGATEAVDEEGKFYGVERLKKAFLSSKSTDSADAIAQEIQRFSQGAVQHDDITFLKIFLCEKRNV